jgi:hypothetical protein
MDFSKVRNVQEKEIKYLHKQISEEEKRKIFEISEVSLWLDSYDDIFSDFDPKTIFSTRYFR